MYQVGVIFIEIKLKFLISILDALGGKIITKLSGSLQACRKMNSSTMDDISFLTYGFVLPAVTSNGSQTEPMPACAPVSRSESNADTQTTRVKRRNIRVQADLNPRTPVAATKVTVTTQTDGDKEHDEFKSARVHTCHNQWLKRV